MKEGTAKDIANLDRYVDLACGIIKQAKADYIEALQTIMKNRNEYKPLKRHHEKWIEWDELRKEHNRIINKLLKNRSEEENKIVKNFKKRKAINKLEKEQMELVNKVDNAIFIKQECEIFFKGIWFQLLTIYKGVDPQIVIKELERQAGWKE